MIFAYKCTGPLKHRFQVTQEHVMQVNGDVLCPHCFCVALPIGVDGIITAD